MSSALVRIFLQGCLGPSPLSVQARTRAGNSFGDLAVNREQLSPCHAYTLHAWFAATIRTVHGAIAVCEPPPALFSACNLDIRPDGLLHNNTPAHYHQLFEVKVAFPILTGHASACACCRLSPQLFQKGAKAAADHPRTPS
eukprot:6175911-Pleurochrysis_carterae.AAC.1